MAIQEIGIPIDLSRGSFNNTVYKDEQLQLIELTKDSNGSPVYVPEGYWISEVIRLADKVQSFKNVVKDMVGTGEYKIYTQSSPNTFTWTEWVEIDYVNGSILSPDNYYARIKVKIIAKQSDSLFVVDGFINPDKYNNDLINSSDGVLVLKKEHLYSMDVLESHIKILRKRIEKSKFKKIDAFRIETR